jgi:hypothetical protein
MKNIIHTERWYDGIKDYVILVFDDFTTSTYEFVRTSEKPAKDIAEALAAAKKTILGHRGIAG